MLFLPPQTTKCCANWWCHSLKNFATCYSKLVLVLVPIYCSKLLFAINNFFLNSFFSLLLSFLFFFSSNSSLSFHYRPKFLSLSLSLSLSSHTVPPQQPLASYYFSSLRYYTKDILVRINALKSYCMMLCMT